MKINCRSQESDYCYDGKGEYTVYDYEGDGQKEDGTWDGKSVICDACYIKIGQPLKGQVAFITGKTPVSIPVSDSEA